MADITIYIPTYKRPQLLRHAIESALGQTWKNIQVIVSDNGSEDETADVVAEFSKKDPRLKYYPHEKNGGLIFNYQFGFSVIDTEYFSFLSDDDLLLPWYCETAMESLNKNPEIAFFAGSTAIIDTNKKLVLAPNLLWKREGIYPAPLGYIEMIGKFPVPTGVMFRKSKTKNIEIDRENPVYWDCDYLMQIAAQHPIAISKKTCALFYTHPASFSASTNGASVRRLAERIRDFQFVDAKKKEEGIKAIYNYFYPLLAYSLLNKCAQKDFAAAKKIYDHLIQMSVFSIRTSICRTVIVLCEELFLAPLLRALKFARRHTRYKSFPLELKEIVDRYGKER